MIKFNNLSAIYVVVIFIALIIFVGLERHHKRDTLFNRNSDSKSQKMVLAIFILVTGVMLTGGGYAFFFKDRDALYAPLSIHRGTPGFLLISGFATAYFPFSIWKFIIEIQRDKIVKKLRQGFKMIKSQNPTERTKGVLLLVNLSRQKMFVGEINQHLQQINLQNSDLINVDLSEINLTGTNLSNSDLSQTLLRFTNLSEANLFGVKFNRAVLVETTLFKSKNIGHAMFDGVVMTDVKMDELTFNQFKMALSEQQKSKMKVKKLDLIELGETILVTIPEN